MFKNFTIVLSELRDRFTALSFREKKAFVVFLVTYSVATITLISLYYTLAGRHQSPVPLKQEILIDQKFLELTQKELNAEKTRQEKALYSTGAPGSLIGVRDFTKDNFSVRKVYFLDWQVFTFVKEDKQT